MTMKKNFYEPFGAFGFLWRSVLFLAGFVLICFLYKILPDFSLPEPWENGVVITPETDSIYQEIPMPHVIEDEIDSTCYDLLNFCPMPGDQGRWGTCVGWSSGYAARTICEAIDSNWTDSRKITKEVFSPWFLYTNIKDDKDYDCSVGSHINDALELMKTKGIPKKMEYDVECNSTVPPQIFPLGEKYKIDDYFRLFSIYDVNEKVEDSLRILRIKRSLINNRPVVIGMKVYKSFAYAGDVWNGDTSVFRGGHAMCVVGFCDNKYEGSFLIQNSWGSDWGNGGRTWVRYDDFVRQTKYAYEIYMKPHYPDSLNHFACTLSMEKNTGEKIGVELDSSQAIKHYKVSERLDSTVQFRCKIENKEPAYVYLVGGNDTDFDTFFPYDRYTSPALVYRPNSIALVPKDETLSFIVDGVDQYFCLLLSPDPIDIEQLRNDMANETGDFKQKLTKAISTRMVAGYDISYSKDQISFTSKTRGEVAVIFVKIN